MSHHHRIAIVAAVSLFVLTACTSGGSTSSGPTTTAPAGPGPAVLAFNQGDTIRFADGVGHVWGNVPTADPTTPVVWSANGTQAAWLDKAGINIVDARTAVDNSTPCSCSGLAPLGNGFATLTADRSELLVFGPGNAVSRTPLNLQTDYAAVAAGGTNQVTIATDPPDSMGAARGETIMSEVNAKGDQHNLLTGTSLVSYAGGTTSPDGTAITLTDIPSDGACWTTPGLYVLKTGMTSTSADPLFPEHDAHFQDAVLDTLRTATNVDWAGRDVVVTFGPNNCQTQAAARYVTYDLVNGRWQFLRDSVSSEGFGADRRTYTIELSDPVDLPSTENYPLGTLVLTSANGVRTVLGRDVTEFWATPVDQAAGRPKSGKSVAIPSGTSQHGAPLSKPYTALVSRIRTALTKDDVAALSALCAQCDPDTLGMTRSESGRAQLLRTLDTHPADDNGSLTYPGLAAQACVDSFKAKQSCTPEQLQDIATLALPASYDLPDDLVEGVSYSASVVGSIRLMIGSDGAAHWVGQSTSAMWTDRQLLITSQSLGAVRVGMTVSQAQQAAGITFDGSGDGASYPTGLPEGYPHLYIQGQPKVNCFGAQAGNGSQRVVTSNGFALGDSVQELLAKYGSQAHPFSIQDGIRPSSGYVVSIANGDLVFMEDPTGLSITGIIGGYSGVSPDSCSG